MFATREDVLPPEENVMTRAVMPSTGLCKVKAWRRLKP